MNSDTPDWLDLDVRTLSLEHSVKSVVQAHAERMEYELQGAWRAGYDYLHVYREGGGLARQDLTEQVTLGQYVFPAHSEQPPKPPQLRYEYTYDLTSVPDHVIRAAVRGELDEYEQLNPDR